MKKFFTILLTIPIIALAPAMCFAARQILPPDANYGDGGSTPGVDGATFTNNATYTVGDGNNFGDDGITSINNTLGNPVGTVNFGGSSTLSMGIGQNASTAILATNLTGAGGVVKIGGNAFITTTTIGAGSPTLWLSGGNLKGTAINFTADGIVRIDAGRNIEVFGNINNTSGGDNRGNIQTSGDTVITGAVGGAGANQRFGSLEINGVVGTTARITGIVCANDATIGAGELELDGNSNIATTNIGTGTLDLDGSLTGTTINFTDDGTVALVGGKDITAAITNNVTSNGTLTLEGAHTITGNVGTTGAGLRLITVGNGLVTIDGDIKATTTNFNANNTLRVGAGHSITGAIITGGAGTGTLTFDGATTTGGTIGTALLPLAAINFNGTTTLGHDIAATTTTVAAGSTVTCSGNRTVSGALTLANSATAGLDLGAATLTVNGVYTQNALSTLSLTVNSPSSFGNITSTGAATVAAGSTVAVTVDGYMPNGATMTILDAAAGAAVNIPTTITSSNSKYTFTGSSINGDLILTVSRGRGFGAYAANSNEESVAWVLDNITNPSADMTTVLNTLDGLSPSQVTQALAIMTPTVDTGVTTASTNALNSCTDTVITHLEYALAPTAISAGMTGLSTGDDYLKGIDVWGQGFGNYTHQDARGSSNGYNASMWGVAMGGDMPMYYDNLRLGVSPGFAQSFVRSKDSSGRTDINSYQGTLYGGYENTNNPYYLDCAFSFAYNDYDGSRHITAGAIDRIAYADYNGQQYSVIAGGGFTMKGYNFNLTPLASVQYMRLHIGGYTETGANALNLVVNSQDYDMLQTGFGAKLEYPIKTRYGTLVPEVHAKWLYDWIGDKQATNSTFSGGGASFPTNGFTPAVSSYDLGTRLMLFTKNNFSIAANYDLEIKEDYWSQAGLIEAKYKL